MRFSSLYLLRLCVITFHSLEDRIVKNVFNDQIKGCICPKEFPVCVCNNKPKGRLITRKPIIADASVYQWNKWAKEFFKEFGFERTTASFELNYHELKDLSIQDMEFVAYGYLPVMVTAGCIQKNTDKCLKNNSKLQLTDRYQKNFLVKNVCNYCYNVIYNTSPVLLVDQKNEIEMLSPKSLRLQFTAENGRETKEILELYGTFFKDNCEVSVPDIDFTRGHFKRGVK